MKGKRNKIISYILSLAILLGTFFVNPAKTVFAAESICLKSGGGYVYIYTTDSLPSSDGKVTVTTSITNYAFDASGFSAVLPMKSGRSNVQYKYAYFDDYVYAGIPADVSKPAVILDKQGGTGGTNSFEVEYGETPATIQAPSPATGKFNYVFLGYYTEPDGKGTQYFTSKGAATKVWEELPDPDQSLLSEPVDTYTLYAYWQENKIYHSPNSPIDSWSGGGYVYVQLIADIPSNDGSITVKTPLSNYKLYANDFPVVLPMKSGCAEITASYTYGSFPTNEFLCSSHIDIYTPAVILAPEGGSGGTRSFDAEYGETPAGITVPQKQNCDFLGYYTETSGGGTKYFNSDGTAAKAWEELPAAKENLTNEPIITYTLYAYWKEHTSEAAVIENLVLPSCENEGGYDVVEYCSNTLDHNTTKVYNPTYAYFATYTDITDYAAEAVPVDYTAATQVTDNVCHHEISRTHVVIPARGHAPGAAVGETHVNPTCTQAGCYDMVVYCTNTDLCDSSVECHKELSRTHTSVSALGHTEQTVKENVINSTCTEDGGYDTVVYCIRSGFEEELSRVHTTVAATGHAPLDPVKENKLEPSCTVPGSYDMVIHCANLGCNATQIAEHVIVPALGHSSGPAVEENRIEPKCTEDGGFDTVIYCNRDGCGKELSRIHTILPAIGHEAGPAVEENRIEAKCEEAGGFDTVTYCSHEGCKEEYSRIHTILPAIGHAAGAGVEENRIEPDCTNTGSYELVIYCANSGCGKELSRTTMEILALGHRNTQTTGAKAPSMISEGFSGEVRCLDCGEIVDSGHVIEKLNSDSKFNPEDVKNMLDEEVNISEETTGQLENMAGDNPMVMMEIISCANNTLSDLRDKLASGEISQAEYEKAVETVEKIIETCAKTGEERTNTCKAAEKIENKLPESFNLDFAGAVSEFYNRQIEAFFNDDCTMDLSVTEETFEQLLEAVDTYVNQMTEAVLELRQCSGAEVVAHVNQVISAISVKTFRDFDKEAADEEFAQNAYNAVLINMQSQVKSMLTEEYKTALSSRKYKGTAKAQLTEKFEYEMASIDDLETFEIMVTEVMRQKFVSVMDSRLKAKGITKAEYDELMSAAADVDSFAPVYKEIFRAWALGLEDKYGVSLEELTKATIDSAKESIKPDTYRKKESEPNGVKIASVSDVKSIFKLAVFSKETEKAKAKKTALLAAGSLTDNNPAGLFTIRRFW